MNKEFIAAIGIALLMISLVEMQVIEVAKATYTIDSGFTQVVVQSPTSNEPYYTSSIKLIVDVRLIYGTSSAIDEFNLENLTCSYNIDGGEWVNFTSMSVTSNTASPSINFWNGLLHKLNVTFVSELRTLSDGVHFVEIRLKTNDSWGGYQDVAKTYFTTNAQTNPATSPTPSLAPTPKMTHSPYPSPSLTLSPSPSPSPTLIESTTESPTQQPTIEPSQTPDRPQIKDLASVIIPTGIIFLGVIAVGLLFHFRKRRG